MWNATVGPLVTKAIVAVNVLVFVITTSSPRAEVRLVLFGPAVWSGQWERLLTAGFVHFSILHLLFNMVLLYRFGDSLERAVGRIPFLVLYLCAVLGGSLGATLLSPEALTGGASGGVYGLVGAVAIGMRQRGANIWQNGIGALIVVNLVLTFALPGISVGGHLGGLAAGTAAGAFMLRTPTSTEAVREGAVLAVAIAVASAAAAVWFLGQHYA